jgi:hypothetical protein
MGIRKPAEENSTRSMGSFLHESALRILAAAKSRSCGTSRAEVASCWPAAVLCLREPASLCLPLAAAPLLLGALSGLASASWGGLLGVACARSCSTASSSFRPSARARMHHHLLPKPHEGEAQSPEEDRCARKPCMPCANSSGAEALRSSRKGTGDGGQAART